jgi:hypothetical protein
VELNQIKYIGLFINTEDFAWMKANFGPWLQRDVANPHVTLWSATKEYIPDYCFGHEYAITIIGEGNDGMNHGFDATIPSALEDIYGNPESAHITASLAPEARAFDTRYLQFNPITPFNVRAYIGYELQDGSILLNSNA